MTPGVNSLLLTYPQAACLAKLQHCLLCAGQQLIAAADIAAENASKVADQVHLRLTGGQAALNGQSTPKRKKRYVTAT